MAKLTTGRAKILAQLKKTYKHLRTVPRNRVAEYYSSVEESITKLAKNPKAELTVQEGYNLSASWRTFEFGKGGNYPFPFSKKPATAVRKWYDAQTEIAYKLAKKSRPIALQFANDYGNMTVRESQRQKLRLIYVSDDSKTVKKFTSVDNFIRFLTLPQYRDARNKLGGRYALARLAKTGRIISIKKSVRIK